MFRILKRLRSHSGLDKTQNRKDFDALLQDGFARLRSVDSETRAQWLRLQRSLAQNEGEVRKRNHRLIPRLAFAVAIVVAALVGTYFYFSPRQLSADTFITGKGEQQRLVLKDSSEVTLNYATELVVPKLQAGKPRLLSLRGEAYFHVRRNETPFIVSTGYADVQVVGTEFNLRAREGMLEVAVINGIVNVRVIKAGKDSTLTLTQNQMALCAQSGFPKRIGNVPSPEYPGWMSGKLFFDKTSFAAACREIEMRFDVMVTIEDQQLRDEIITGTLEAKTAESALTALCGLTKKRFQFDGQSFKIF